MPTVPRVTQPRVSTQALPGVRQQGTPQPPPLDFTGPARLIGAIADHERQRADNAAIMDADAKAARLQTDLQVELSKIGGRDAAAVPDVLKERWQEGTEEIRKGLNPRQQQAVEQRLAERYTALYGVAQTHMAREADAYDKATLEQALTHSTDLVALNAGNHEVVGTEMANMENAIRTYAQSHASQLPDGWADQRVAEAFSKGHTAVIARLLDSGQDRDAKAYFTLVKAEIGGADIGRVEKALDVGSTLGESQRQMDRILALNLTEAESYEEAKKLEPDLRKATSDQLDVEFGRRKRGKEAQRVADLETSYTAVLEHGTLPPTSILARLPVTDRANVIAFFKKKDKGDPVETDWSAYYDLKKQAASDPDTFAGVNLLTFRNRLGDTEFKQAVGWQTARKAGRQSDDLNGYQPISEQIDYAISRTGLDKKSNKDEVLDFEHAANLEIADWQRSHNNKAIPPEEVTKITDGLLKRRVFKERVGVDVEFPAFGKDALSRDDRSRAYVPFKDIPADAKESLQARFRRRGKTATTTQLQRAYAAFLLDDDTLMRSILDGQ